MDGGWLSSVQFGEAKLQKQKAQGCAAMDGGWLSSVQFGEAKLQKQKAQGCAFCGRY
jgi:hypothetical protein